MHEKIASYLANEMGKTERLDFERLLVEDAALQNEVFAQIELLNRTSEGPDFNSKEAFKRIEPSLSTKVVEMTPKRNFSFLKIAATLLIVLTAGYFISRTVNQSSQGQEVVYSTTSQIDVFQLSDGTQVRLNSNSRLELAEGFGLSNREVNLMGAANFEVTKDASLPFVINAHNGSVEVLGTVFEVNAYPQEDIELNVAEGKVKFASKTTAKQDLFEAGDRGILTADGKVLTKTAQKNKNYAAWWTRRLVFEDAALNEVFADLEKAYNVEIQYEQALANCIYGAILENYTLTEALEAIKTIFPNIEKIEIKDSFIKLEGTACKN